MESKKRALLAIFAWYVVINTILWSVFGILKSQSKKSKDTVKAKKLMNSAEKTRMAAIILTLTPAFLSTLVLVFG
jgi:hypothetical protein